MAMLRFVPGSLLGLLALTAAGQAQQARLTGMVTDTLNRRRLAGARVTIEGIDRVFLTDANGRFVADSLAPGRYRVSFRHPVLDTLGIRSSIVVADVAAGADNRVSLGVPSGRAFMRLCPSAPGLETRGAVFGMVRNAVSDEVVGGTQVRIAWDNVVLDPSLGLRRRVQTKVVTADSSGLYRACDLPPDAAVSVSVSAEGFSAASGEVSLRPEEAVPLHFSIAPADARPTATLSGRITDTERKPLAGAEVWVITGQGAETGIARTDSGGNFTLTGLPPGTGVVAVRRIGSAPAKRTVSLGADRTTTVTLALASQGVALPELNVTAKRASRAEQSGFGDRKEQGFGKFFDRAAVDKTVGSSAGDVLRTLPSVRLGQGRFGTALVNSGLRGSVSGGPCALVLLVDGIQTPPDAIIGLPKEEIDAIEVYDNPDQVPVEYRSQATSCGAVLVWTRR